MVERPGDNLVLLCRHHHWLLHDGGCYIVKDGTTMLFFRAGGTWIPRVDDARHALARYTHSDTHSHSPSRPREHEHEHEPRPAEPQVAEPRPTWLLSSRRAHVRECRVITRAAHPVAIDWRSACTWPPRVTECAQECAIRWRRALRSASGQPPPR
jgi:hypothetical protein